jgi:2-keto-3-deoxy-6-phosphogluconate aldolase
MSDKQSALTAIVRQGFVPIFVHDARDPRRLAAAAVAAGCRVLEYSCRRPDAREMIPWIKREFPGVRVLAATLVDSPRVALHLQRTQPGFLTVDEAVDLGADGLVSFLAFRESTYARHAGGQVMVAGAGSPNEALAQLELGADLVKVTVGTPSGRDLVMKSRVPTHGCIPYFISGGLRSDALEPYLEAGVVATAAGFDLLLGGGVGGEEELDGKVGAAIRRMLDGMQVGREKHQAALAAAIRGGAEDLLAAGPWFRAAPPAS